jgi:energy-coupling factor transport system substrate-specific component
MFEEEKMNTVTEPTAKTGLRAWTTRDLLVVAVIGIVAAIVLMGVNYFATVLMAVNPIFGSVLSGVYFISIIIPLYIVRRPGAAILGTLVYGLASAPLHPFGWAVSLFAVIFALPVELVFLLTRYRNYRLWVLMVAGAAGCLLSFVMTGLYGDYASLALPVQLITLGLFLLSGALLGGWLAKVLADSLMKTGVLNSFAIAQAEQQEI